MRTSARELTFRAVVIGLIVGGFLTAAITYLALYAGLAISASIPAALVTTGLMRGLLKRGTILENNIAQTIGSAGEALAVGVVFTIPALVISGVRTSLDYWEVTLVAIIGGILGVVFTIPLRQTVIVGDASLTYPESVACAKVLQAGEDGARNLVAMFLAFGGGLLFKGGSAVIGAFKGSLEVASRAAGTLWYLGADISVALIGVGIIVEFEMAALLLMGGLIAWGVGLPLLQLGAPLLSESAVDVAWATWSEQIRFLGVGAMAMSGLWSVYHIRRAIFIGVRDSLTMLHAAKTTQTDLSPRIMVFLLGLTLLVAYLLMCQAVMLPTTAMAMSGTALVTAFLFVAVACYLVGLVGNSNNPISGLTICALLIASVVLILARTPSGEAMVAVLLVAGIVSCAAATAGDTAQHLKTGALLGANPRTQQIAQLIGVVAFAFIIAPIVVVLHNAYGIGGSAQDALKAPQAVIFANLAHAIFAHEGLPWRICLYGVFVAIGSILIDLVLQRWTSKRFYVMPVAIGMYLPLSLTVTIFLGGCVSLFIRRRERKSSTVIGEAMHFRAILISAGLITGEALMGIGIALLPILGIVMPNPGVGRTDCTMLAVLAVLAVIVWYAVRPQRAHHG